MCNKYKLYTDSITYDEYMKPNYNYFYYKLNFAHNKKIDIYN